MKSGKRLLGKCHLTLDTGVYVNAHLLPRALTRPLVPGNPFIQSGVGTRPIRRWDSWSDRRLLIEKGENILRDLDDWAIYNLRKHELVWSGWNGANRLPATYTTIPGSDHSVRVVHFDEPNRMRLFFLSLLWRSAATSRSEFEHIKVSVDDLEILRNTVLTGSLGPLSFYPCQLVQHSTRGEVHNLTPIISSKPIKFSESGEPLEFVSYIRFYFEGLVAHFLCFEPGRNVDKYVEEIRVLLLGGESELVINVVPYENSFQQLNLRKHVVEARTTFSKEISKLSK